MPGITPDPSKRSFLLPPGCKDLIDVLQGAKGKKSKPKKVPLAGLGAPPPGHKHSAPVNGKLADIERHVQTVFGAKAVLFSLCISHPGSETLVTVSDHDGINASVNVELGTENENTLRESLGRNGLQAPPVEPEMPEVFTPGLPVYQTFTISPPAADAATIARFIGAFLQEAKGLNADSELWFRTFEISEE